MEWPTHNASRHTSIEPLLAVAGSLTLTLIAVGMRGVLAPRIWHFAKISVTAIPLVLAMFRQGQADPANMLPLRHASRGVTNTMLGRSVRSPRDQEEAMVDAM